MSGETRAPSTSPAPARDPRGNEPAGPTIIGRFLVLNLVGKGAMGEVYAAYDPELERKVAIKLLRGKRGDGSEATEGRARMMREAQAIAKLSHPNVVVVYDVGTFNDQVFVAMEFVDGHTLWYWMHSQPRPWQDILKIFVDAGRGLAAAHEKGLVHRDFKPENVMIGVDGQVRVMDFGLARTMGAPAVPAILAPAVPAAATAPVTTEDPSRDSPPANSTRLPNATSDNEDVLSTRELGASPTVALLAGQTRVTASDSTAVHLTRTGAILGTPAYMAPEQFQGRETDPRTDQFSFCVALYEALYGERPFAGNTPQTLEASVLRGDVRPAPAKTEVPQRVRKLLLRGLRPDADQRWPSMKALLAELDENRLFARRRRFAESAASKLSDIWQAPSRGRPPETAARVEMREAFRASGKVYAAAAFETASGILDRYARSWSEMYIDICQATHVRGEQSAEVLDLRMACLMDMRERLRALCQVFRQASPEVVENAVSAANALGTVDRCANLEYLRSAVKPPEDQATRAAVNNLRARLAEVRVLGLVGRLTDGLKASAALEPEIRALGYVPLVAEMLLECGKLLNERREGQASAHALEEAVWTAELCRHEEVAAQAATSLVFVTGDVQQRFDAAEIWARHAETILKRMGGQDVLWGWLFNNRGAMRLRQGRLADSLADGRLAVAAKEKAGGADSADVAMSLSNIALCLAQEGKSNEALPHLERAVRILDGTLGPDHPRGAFVLSNLAEALNDQNRFADARHAASRAMAIFERELSSDDLTFTYPLGALGIALLGEGRADDSVAILERTVALCDARETSPGRLAEVHFALARALLAQGRDPTRGRMLARRARGEYELATPSPAVERDLRQLELLLELPSHPPAAPEPLPPALHH